MAIDLYALSLSSHAQEAVLIKPTDAPKSYRLNVEKVKADFESIKAESIDLLKQGPVSEAEIAAMYTGTLDRSVSMNYGPEAFFSKQAPAATDAEGNTTIMGLRFSETELAESRAVLQAAAESIGAGIGKNGNLDYRTYAEMGIALSAVKGYAATLGGEKGAAVVNAMEQYNEGLLNMEKELLSGDQYVENPYEGVSDYYGIGHRMDDVSAINDLIDEMNRVSGGDRKHVEPGRIGTVQSATNQELISALSDLFSNLDLSDSGAVNSALNSYRTLMRPMYAATGHTNAHGQLDRVLDEGVARLESQIQNLRAAMAYRKVDLEG